MAALPIIPIAARERTKIVLLLDEPEIPEIGRYGVARPTYLKEIKDGWVNCVTECAIERRADAAMAFISIQEAQEMADSLAFNYIPVEVPV
jgi:hypothetical protein